MICFGDEVQFMIGVIGDLVGIEFGLILSLIKNVGVFIMDQLQKGKDFISDQEVCWCLGCGDYVIFNII